METRREIEERIARFPSMSKWFLKPNGERRYEPATEKEYVEWIDLFCDLAGVHTSDELAKCEDIDKTRGVIAQGMRENLHLSVRTVAQRTNALNRFWVHNGRQIREKYSGIPEYLRRDIMRESAWHFKDAIGKRGRRKTGQNRISKTFSLDKQQVEWLDSYQGDSSEIMRQLLGDYIDASVSAQPEAVKLVFKLRTLQRQEEKLETELNGYKIVGTAIRKLDYAKVDYADWRDKKDKEEDEAYQLELKRRKRVLDVAEASYQAFKGNYDALQKKIAEIEDQLLKSREVGSPRKGSA